MGELEKFAKYYLIATIVSAIAVVIFAYWYFDLSVHIDVNSNIPRIIGIVIFSTVIVARKYVREIFSSQPKRMLLGLVLLGVFAWSRPHVANSLIIMVIHTITFVLSVWLILQRKKDGRNT